MDATIPIVRIAVSLTLCLLASLSCGQRVSSEVNTPMTLEVGQPFPNIVLPNLADGRPGSIGQFRGRKLLLHVFASW